MSSQLETSNPTHPEFQVLIDKACGRADDMSAFHIHSKDIDPSIDVIPSILRKVQPVLFSSSQEYPAPPWRRGDWQYNWTPDGVKCIHEALRHPEEEAFLKRARDHARPHPAPSKVVNAISQIQCRECDETKTLPRSPKPSLWPETYPNVPV